MWSLQNSSLCWSTLVNIPVVEALEQMSGYVMFMKDLVTKKRVISLAFSNDVHRCSVIQTRSLIQKKADPGAFTIPCTIRSIKFAKFLCDLGASINLMPWAIYENLGLGITKPTTMRLMMLDRSVKRPVGILCDILVKVDTFIFPANFFSRLWSRLWSSHNSWKNIWLRGELWLMLKEVSEV